MGVNVSEGFGVLTELIPKPTLLAFRRRRHRLATSAGRCLSSCFKNNVIHVRASGRIAFRRRRRRRCGRRRLTGIVATVAAAATVVMVVHGRHDAAQIVRIRVRHVVMVPMARIRMFVMCANRSIHEWHFDQSHVQAVPIAIVNAHRLH